MKIFNLISRSPLKNFIMLWAGQSISKMGSSMTTFALIIWIYKTKNTAMSAMFLSVFSFSPYVLVSFLAGSIIDRFSKKKVLFICDSVAAICILIAFMLFTFGKLEVWHLYVLNFISGLMLAFQAPATKVASTLILSEKYYIKTNGLRSLSDSVITVVTPALGAFVLSIFGVSIIFILDILSFVIAIVSLVFFVNIPDVKSSSMERNIIKETLEGFTYLKANKSFLYMIFFMAIVNLIAFMAYMGILPIMILAKTSNNEQIVGIVNSFGGIGAIIAGLIATIVKPPKKLVRVSFMMTAISFIISDLTLGIGNSVILWSFATFLGDFPIPFINAYQNSYMQSNIPVEIQGRIFSIQGTLQYVTIPIGYLMGGYLADNVFEPLMRNSVKTQSLFGGLVGTGKGSGMAIMFICSAILGCLTCVLAFRNKYIKEI